MLASIDTMVAQLAASYDQLLAEQAAQSAAGIAELQQELAEARAAQMAAEVAAMQQATMLAVYRNSMAATFEPSTWSSRSDLHDTLYPNQTFSMCLFGTAQARRQRPDSNAIDSTILPSGQ